jgi:hypothetical protein
MTPTTDLQKPFTDEQLKAWAETGGTMRSLIAMRLAARVIELEAENKRLREANYKAFTDGMEAAAQICGTLAEVEYDDADGFEAATGCEAAIMRVVKEQRTEQARAALKGGEI